MDRSISCTTQESTSLFLAPLVKPYCVSTERNELFLWYPEAYLELAYRARADDRTIKDPVWRTNLRCPYLGAAIEELEDLIAEQQCLKGNLAFEEVSDRNDPREVANNIDQHMRKYYTPEDVDSDNFVFTIRLTMDGNRKLSINSSKTWHLYHIRSKPRSLLRSPPKLHSSVRPVHIHCVDIVVQPTFWTTHDQNLAPHVQLMTETAGIPRSGTMHGDDVLVVDPKGRVMGTLFSTIYFWRHNRWVTPARQYLGRRDPTLNYAVSIGVRETLIMRQDIEKGETVWVSNTEFGFRVGRIATEEQ